MCFKRKSVKTNWEHNSKIALLFWINNYPGSSNDLRYCNEDINRMKAKMPDFQIREFIDWQVTKKNFIDQLRYAIEHSIAGDVIYLHYSGHGSYVRDVSGDEIDGYDETLYLYDGNLIDDDLNTACENVPEGVTLVVVLDSCHSGSATKELHNPHYHKARFMPPAEGKELITHKRIRRVVEPGLNRIVVSACAENETATEAQIGTSGGGIFTYYWAQTLHRDLTYRQWFEMMSLYLPNKEFTQHPVQEGSDKLLDKKALT